MTYEYCCTNPDCQHAWESEQSIKDTALEFCPECGQKTAKRLVSGGCGVRFIGEGWTPATHFGDPMTSGAKAANTIPSAPPIPRGPGSFNN